jgi:hypothetical protein
MLTVRTPRSAAAARTVFSVAERGFGIDGPSRSVKGRVPDPPSVPLVLIRHLSVPSSAASIVSMTLASVAHAAG